MIGCATCGADPVGTYNDGSPRYPSTCDHAPIYGGQAVEPERIVIELSPADMALGRACGEKRLADSKRRKLRDKLGVDATWKHEIGAQGEIAFARWLGVPWECTTGAFGKPDVAGCQIKTRQKTSYELVVHDNDPGRTPCVLISAHPPRFWIRGWIFARDAKRPEWKKTVVGDWEGYFVPTHELRPMADFLTSDAVRAARGLAPAEQ